MFIVPGREVPPGSCPAVPVHRYCTEWHQVRPLTLPSVLLLPDDVAGWCLLFVVLFRVVPTCGQQAARTQGKRRSLSSAAVELTPLTGLVARRQWLVWLAVVAAAVTVWELLLAAVYSEGMARTAGTTVTARARRWR